MSEEPLSVDEVDVVRAPGFESGGFTVEDLCPGVNVIHGPNAAGKTTMAQSIQWLLWPDGAAERAEVIGGLAIDGEQWRVDVDRGRAEYQRDGQEANRPSLPPSDQQDRYVLSLHELLQHETRDETFAQAILRESVGGYDLPAAIEVLDFDDSPTHTQKGEVRDAKSAVNAWREAKREMEELQDEQRRLPALKRELEEAEDADQRVDILEQAIDYAEARDELESAEAKLAEYSDILHEIDGGEAEAVKKLDGQIEGWEEKKNDASTALQEAEEKLAEADLPEDGVPDGFIDQVKQRRDELESLKSRKRDREESLADREEQRDSALDDIPIDVDDGDLSKLDADGWKNISAFAKEAEAVNAEREVRETVERWLTDREELEHERSTLDRGSQALEQWLVHPPTQTSEGSSSLRVTDFAFAGLLALSGLALGSLVQPVGYALVLVAAALLWYVNRSGSPDAEDDSDRKAHRDVFEGQGLEPPESWEEDSIRERLMELYDAIAAHRIADERAQQRQALLSDVDELEEREEALEERRQELIESLGAAPETSDIELVATTNAIGRWQEAHGRVLGLREEIDAIEGEIDTTRSTLIEELAPYGYEEIDDAAEATGCIRDLESRVQDHDEAAKAISDAEGIIGEAESKLEGFREERTTIFDELDLDHDEPGRLQSLCEQADEFDEVESAHEKAKHLATSEEEDLEAMPGFEPELKEREVSDLEEEKAEAVKMASAYDELNTEITEIEKDIRDARSDNRVEDALTERERAFDALADQLDSDYDSMVGHALAEHVREATTDASRPAVFEQARKVLARISRGRYRLDLDDGDETFRAYDTVKDRGFALDELSSATRLQVLLAVRVAFVERHEQGTKLPVLLDETLANTDDGKAEVIINSMLELARGGRQLFYFTAQGDEVARWLTAVEEDGDVEHTVIDLADVQDLDRHVEVPELDRIADRPASPPDPEDHDHDSYGEEIDVPPFDPRRGAGTAHLWYVVEDLDLLHQLLGLGIERWGQLENLLSTPGSQAVVNDPDRLDPVQYNGAALEEFVRSWQKGRGERVDRNALEDSGAVSENFIDRVTELVDELNGDGERIIEALRDGQVNRFRSDNMDELEAYFEENGYIESVDPLEPEQIRVRLINCLVERDLPREEARERGMALLDRLAASSSG